MTSNLSPEEMAARAKANEAEAKETARLVGEAQERERLSGIKPVLTSVADSVMEKLKAQFPANQEGDGTGTGEDNPS